MAIELTDDGTLDTVLRCSHCGEEFRFNYDAGTDNTEEGEGAYDAFVDWCIESTEDDHECDQEALGPQDEDITTEDHHHFYYLGRCIVTVDEDAGRFAHVAKVKRNGSCVFEWVRTQTFYRDGENHERKFATRCAIERDALFNVEAYQPGDFKQFFNDPRTRENYLKWAPMLLEAEEYKAGNREVREREEMLDFALGAAYARGWNDRMHFGLPMNLARVKPPEERSN